MYKLPKVLTDEQAYMQYPNQNWVYNKLELYRRLYNNCFSMGPAGTFPKDSGRYFVKPIMNLYGMGVGSCEVYHENGQFFYKNEPVNLPPGYMWMPYFTGNLITYDVKLDSKSQVHIVEDSTLAFNGVSWVRVGKYGITPHTAKEIVTELLLGGVETVNVELIQTFIDILPIEIHLRPNSDLMALGRYSKITPVFSDKKLDIENSDVNYYTDFDDGGGFLKPHRTGFIVE